MQAQNTFNDGMVLDGYPLMASNSILTNALNATIVTMNGNEGVLLNDMGNARIDNAKLPSGYIPIGMKEYGGIIYVACYNPLTKKGLIGCFPSPLRLHTATQISGLTQKFSFPDITKVDDKNYILNSTISRCEIFPKDTIIRSGDKFAVGINISEWGQYVSNYNNIIDNLVATPMNRMYTFGIATLDNNGLLNDITNQLKRYDISGNVINFDNNTSDLYKFNTGYWQNSISLGNDTTSKIVSLDSTNTLSKQLNTYNSKLFGRLFLYAKYNAVDSIEASIVGYKKLSENDTVKNPVLSGDKYVFNDDANLILLINLTYKYNCPDGSFDLNNVELDGKKLELAEPLEGYKYYFDKENSSSIIKGVNLSYIDSNKNSITESLNFALPKKDYKNYITGYGYPIYDKLTNLYSFSQIYPILIKSESIDTQYTITPVMKVYDGSNGLIDVSIPGLSISGRINSDNFNSGDMELNTWNYYIDTDSVKLRWGFNSQPRESDNFSNITFDFYDVSKNYTLKDGDITEGTPRWSYVTKNRVSYNGVFSESFDINNFIDKNAVSENMIIPNTLFYVKISWLNNNLDYGHDHRWLLLSGLYNTSYWGDSTYDPILDYNDFNKCYFNYNGENYIYKDSEWTTTKNSEDVKDKEQIPSDYFILNVESQLTKSNAPGKVTKTASDDYLFSLKDIEGITEKSIYTTYNVLGVINNSLLLTLDSTHGISFENITPEITDVTVNSSNTAVVGNEKANDLVGDINATITKTNNSFNIIYNLNCKLVLKGSIGKTLCNVLDTLDTLPSIQDLVIKDEGGAFFSLNNSYAIRCGINTDGKIDYLVLLIPINSSNKYDAIPYYLLQFKNSDEHSHWFHLGYDKIIHLEGGRKPGYTYDLTLKDAFQQYIPEELSIIIIRGLGPFTAKNEDNYPAWGDYNNKYTVHSISYDSDIPVDKLHPKAGLSGGGSQYERFYKFIVLIRDANKKDFTVVNYMFTEGFELFGEELKEPFPLGFVSSNLESKWKNFLSNNFHNYTYYDSSKISSDNLYSVVTNLVYNNKYDVSIDLNITASVKTSNYTNLLNGYSNVSSYKPILINNSDIKVNSNIKITTIGSPTDLIDIINNADSTVFIDSYGNVVLKDSNNNLLTTDNIYLVTDNEKGAKLTIRNNLVINNGNLYTRGITNRYGVQECYYGISSRSGKSSSTVAVTFGNAPYIDLLTDSDYLLNNPNIK